MTIREGFVRLINDSKHEHDQKFMSMTINHTIPPTWTPLTYIGMKYFYYQDFSKTIMKYYRTCNMHELKKNIDNFSFMGDYLLMYDYCFVWILNSPIIRLDP